MKFQKYNQKIQLFLFAFLFFSISLLIFIQKNPIQAKAASASIWFEQLGAEALVGQEIEVQLMISSDTKLGDFEGYISYNAEVLQYISGPSCITGGDGVLKVVDIGASPSWDTRSYVMKFKTLKRGTSLFEITDTPIAYEYENGNAMSVSSSIMSVVVQPATIDSNNAKLAAMKINPGVLTPTFDGNIFDYSTLVDSKTEKLVVSAVPEDLSSTVSVTGNNNLKVGNNEVIIKVTSPAGTELTYTIQVIKEEEKAEATPEPTLEPEQIAEWRFEARKENGMIKIVGQYNYSVQEKDSSITIPAGYSKTSFILNNITIPAYQETNNPSSDFLLLILENEASERGLYRYDRVEKTIQRYTSEKAVISSGSQSLAEQELLQDALDLVKYDQTINKLGFIIAILSAVCFLLLGVIVFLSIRFLQKKYKHEK